MNLDMGASSCATGCATGGASPALASRLKLLRAAGFFDPAHDTGPPSPCIAVCRMDEGSGYCQGCWRTLDEIRQWAVADAGQRRMVWARIAQRAGLPAL